MNSGRVIAVVVLLAGFVAFFLLRQPDELRKERGAPADTPAAASRTITQRAILHGGDARVAAETLPNAPSRELIGSDPEAAARAWHARATEVVEEKQRRQFGDEVSRLMRLPFVEAWEPLVAKASEGDVAAAAAALNIATACNAQARLADSPHRETPRRAPSAWFPDLPATWKPFVDRIADLEEDADAARLADCSQIGGFMDVALLLFDRFIRTDNVDVRIEIAAENEDTREAITDLREILAGHDDAHGRQVLGERLLQSKDPAERAEGLSLLEPLAADDAAIAGTIGQCLASGCGGAARDPDAARPWLEQAAGAGDPAGAARLQELLAAKGENAAAWAWSLYRLDLALDGCLDYIAPSHATIAATAQYEARRKAVLSPAEQNAGLAMSYAIAGRWEKKAKERLACAD